MYICQHFKLLRQWRYVFLNFNSIVCNIAYLYITYFFYSGLASSKDQACPSGLVCCASLGRCDVPGCPAAPATSCSGIANNKIVCKSATTFNICLNGIEASAQAQSCQAGLVCCQGLNRCDLPGCAGSYGYQPPAAPSSSVYVAPTATPSSSVYAVPMSTTPISSTTKYVAAPLPSSYGSCSGIADNHIVCKSANTFNICLNGLEANAPPQTCQPGLVCCQNNNSCDLPGCPTNLPAQVQAPGGNCAGKADNYVVCTSATTFNICKGGVKPFGDQACQSGLMCCEGLQRCDFTCGAPAYVPPALTTFTAAPVSTYTPPAPISSCSGKADNYMICTGKTTLNYCLNGALVNAPSQSCPPGLDCCEGQQACGYPGCNTPQPAPQSCASVADNHIACKSLTTFNICYGGLDGANVDQCCPAGTVCCANLNRCDVAGCAGTPSPAPVYNPPAPPPVNPLPNPAGCNGKADNQIICTSATSFNICHGQSYFGNNQNCPAGLVCCDNLNRCDYNGCVGTPSPIPTNSVSTPYTPPVTSSNCVGKPDNRVVCTSATSFNICQGGSPASKFDQSCPSGLKCCETTQSCESSCPASVPYIAPAPPVVDCSGKPDGKMICTGGNTFTLVQGGVCTPNQMCPQGLVCCDGKQMCDHPGCNGAPYVYTPPSSPSPPSYVVSGANCTGVSDGHITCTSATMFTICQNEKPATQVSQSCQPGLYCCANTNRCDVAGCPPVGYVPPVVNTPAPYNPNSCQGIPDGHIYCTSQNTFNMCQNGLPVSSASQTCQPGLVCCAATNRCDVSGCPSAYSPPMIYSNSRRLSLIGMSLSRPLALGLKLATDLAVTVVNCAGKPDNYIMCSSTTTFNFCLNGVPVQAYDQTCQAGLTCCEATQR